MKLFYYKAPSGNFGDDLNAWLWPRLIPEMLDDDDSELFVGIGSILDERVPQAPRKIVFGTGIGYGRLPAIDERWSFYCVRGPLTAKALGLPRRSAITDSAALVAAVGLPEQLRRYPFSFMPHFRTPDLLARHGIDLRAACQDAGVHYIDPRQGVDEVLIDFRSTGVLLAEAMHGAIVADALRVPWVPLKICSQVLNLKWRDWCGSLNMDYEPVIFPSPPDAGSMVDLAQFLYRTKEAASPTMSREDLAADLLGQLCERLRELKRGSDQGVCRGSSRMVPDAEVFKGVPWLYEINLSIREIAGLVPPGENFILVDDLQWGGGEVLAGRHAIPFTERNGQYWGPPPDDATAIRELDRLRKEGAHSIVFAWPAFWWLSYYPEFRRYLMSTYECPLQNERLVVFKLSG